MLEAFVGLTLTERLVFLEAALHTMREEASAGQTPSAGPSAAAEVRLRMAEAAELLLTDYSDRDGDLTAFTTLDSEPFYATR